MKINGFGKRFLSLLLAMVALVGLLSVGAMAEEESLAVTAPNVTLKVQNVQLDGNTVTADVVVAETVSAEYGIAAGEFTVVVPDGLTLTSIQSNVFKSSNPDGIEGLTAASNVDTCYFGFFIDILEYEAWLGGGKLATLTFTVKDGAYGDQVIGIKNPALFTSGSSGSSGVEVDEDSRLPMNTPTSDTLSLPSVRMHYYYQGHGGEDYDVEMAQGATPVEPSPAPTATGYTFGGWYKQPTCVEEFDFNTALEADGYAYAKWTANQTEVTFDVNGGTELSETQKTKTVAYGENYGDLPTPQRTGYVFHGWYTAAEDGTKIESTTAVPADLASTQTLYAHWGDKIALAFKGDTQTATYDGNAKFFELKPESGTAYDPAPTVSVEYSKTGENSFSTSAPTVAGVYDVRLTAAEDDTYKALNQTIPDGLVIKKMEIAKPTLTEDSFEYDSAAHTVLLVTSPDSGKYDLEADTATATAVGTYYAEVTLKDNFCANFKWAGEDDDTVTICLPYTITPKKITAPTADDTSFTYNGGGQTYQLKLVEGSMKLADDSDELMQTNAGTYTIKVELTDKVNTVWESTGKSDDLEYTFNIAKKPLTVPTAANTVLTYNKSNQMLSVTYGTDEESFITATGDSAEVVGTYAAKYTIKTEYQQNYCWAGMAENVTEVTIPYTITPKKITPPTAGTETYTYSDSEQTYKFADKGDETEYDVTGDKQTNAGNYTVTVALKDKDNTTWLDGTTVDQTYSFVIQKADQEAPTDLSTEAETIYKKGDGKLMGLDKVLMEYRLKGSNAEFVQPARKEITLPAGTYEVRYAEDLNHNASPVAEVTVGEGHRLRVTFHTGAGSDVDPQTGLGYKDPVAKPDPAPTYPGFTLVGWYKDEEYKDDWDFATDRVEGDTDLYAKWELSIGIEGDARFTEGKAPAEGVKIIVGKGLDQTDTQTLELKKVTVAGKKLDDENYTVAYGEDGLTITLKQDYLNTLGVDEYEIGVVVNSEHLGDGRNLAVTLTVDPEPTEAGKPAGKPGKAVKTGDSSDLLLWSILSLGAGAGLVCIGKKRREN